MAIRQYIGARYVPIFMGEHDISKSYEPLSIVTDAGATTSYTSKKFVPIGTPLTDNNYWAVTGTVSGSILNLQNRMALAESDIVNMEATLSDIVPKVNVLYDHKYIFLGDSWGYGTGGVVGHGWCHFAKTYLDLDGDHCNWFAANSYGFRGLGGTLKFIDLLRDNIANISIPLEEVTDLVVAGGINDAGHSYVDLISSITEFCNYVYSIMPNVKITIMNIGKTTNPNHDNLLYNSYRAYINGACENNARYIADPFIHCNKYYNYTEDIHMSEAGYNELGKAIACALNGKDSSIYDYKQGNITPDIRWNSGTVSYVSLMDIHNIALNISIDLHCTAFNWTPNSQPLILGENTLPHIRGNLMQIHLPLLSVNTANGWVDIGSAIITINDSGKLVLNAVYNDGALASQLEGVTQIYAYPRRFNVDPILV